MKLSNYALLVVGSLAAATCFAATPTPDCATSRATLRVGTQFGIPPFDSVTPAGTITGTVTGFDIAIACELRKRLGYNAVQIVSVNPTSTVPLT
ncbi:hypothetical protein H0W26_03290, partial [Candidatus Dependentiae bacterium]|nr:hypothetical protein [Candidatus Dependentiae bacterium]